MLCSSGRAGMDPVGSRRRAREEPSLEDMVAVWYNVQDLFRRLPQPHASYLRPLAWVLLHDVSRDGQRALAPQLADETLRHYVSEVPPPSDLFSLAYRRGVTRTRSTVVEDDAVAYVEERFAAAKSGDKTVRPVCSWRDRLTPTRDA